MLTLKTTFENDTRRRQFASSSTLANLKSVVQELYGQQGSGVTLKYVDDDGDLITLGSEAEMRECVAIAEKKNNGVMRVSVFRVAESRPAAAAVEAKKEEESDSDSDSESSSSEDDDNEQEREQQQQNPFVALQSFFDGFVQGEEGIKVRTFFEQLGEQLQTQLQAGSERVQEHAAPHVKKIQLALEELLARGVLTRDTFRDVSEAVAASPRAVQDFVLSLTEKLAAATPQQAPLSSVRHAATCDGCDTPIVGVRFKCVNCADYDLCSRCEARNAFDGGSVHERTHAFLKLPFAVPLGIGQLLPNLRPSSPFVGGAGRCADRRRRLMMCPYMQAHPQQQQQQHQNPHHGHGHHGFHHAHRQLMTEDFASYSWFKKNCTRENAEAILKNAQVGAFVVRPGANESTMNLSFKDEKVGVVHASITKSMRGWQLTLGDVVTPPEASLLALVKSLAPTLKIDAVVPTVAASSSSSSSSSINIEQAKPIVVVDAAVAAAAVAAAPIIVDETKAVVESASAAPSASPFARQLEQLKNMGFTDESVLQALLELHNGDVLTVVQELIQ